jgi:hypothetical protein
MAATAPGVRAMVVWWGAKKKTTGASFEKRINGVELSVFACPLFHPPKKKMSRFKRPLHVFS